ncbi:hypothetical protein ACOME3_009253 [Neoechinorhynchus agilis]
MVTTSRRRSSHTTQNMSHSSDSVGGRSFVHEMLSKSKRDFSVHSAVAPPPPQHGATFRNASCTFCDAAHISLLAVLKRVVLKCALALLTQLQNRSIRRQRRRRRRLLQS